MVVVVAYKILLSAQGPSVFVFWGEGLRVGASAALNLSTLNAGILKMMQQVRLIVFSLNMVDYSMSFLSLSTWDFFARQVVGIILNFMLQSYLVGLWGGLVVVAVSGGETHLLSWTPCLETDLTLTRLHWHRQMPIKLLFAVHYLYLKRSNK